MCPEHSKSTKGLHMRTMYKTMSASSCDASLKISHCRGVSFASRCGCDPWPLCIKTGSSSGMYRLTSKKTTSQANIKTLALTHVSAKPIVKILPMAPRVGGLSCPLMRSCSQTILLSCSHAFMFAGSHAPILAPLSPRVTEGARVFVGMRKPNH